MSELNTIYDEEENVVGTFKHGVAWCRKTGNRLGSYDENRVYSNSGEPIAEIQRNTVISLSGEVLGKLEGQKILVSGNTVGKFIGCRHAGAAAIPLAFQPNVV